MKPDGASAVVSGFLYTDDEFEQALRRQLQEAIDGRVTEEGDTGVVAIVCFVNALSAGVGRHQVRPDRVAVYHRVLNEFFDERYGKPKPRREM